MRQIIYDHLYMKEKKISQSNNINQLMQDDKKLVSDCINDEYFVCDEASHKTFTKAASISTTFLAHRTSQK